MSVHFVSLAAPVGPKGRPGFLDVATAHRTQEDRDVYAENLSAVERSAIE